MKRCKYIFGSLGLQSQTRVEEVVDSRKVSIPCCSPPGTMSMLRFGRKALLVQLPKHSYDTSISRAQRDIGHQLAGNT